MSTVPGAPENQEEQVQRFVDHAKATPGVVEALRAGDPEALIAFLEMAPGAHIESMTVQAIPCHISNESGT